MNFESVESVKLQCERTLGQIPLGASIPSQLSFRVAKLAKSFGSSRYWPKVLATFATAYPTAKSRRSASLGRACGWPSSSAICFSIIEELIGSRLVLHKANFLQRQQW